MECILATQVKHKLKHNKNLFYPIHNIVDLSYKYTRDMDDLITCSKCAVLPYDILMMTCNHNLCTKCAL